jgi:hypothetical protein
MKRIFKQTFLRTLTVVVSRHSDICFVGDKGTETHSYTKWMWHVSSAQAQKYIYAIHLHDYWRNVPTAINSRLSNYPVGKVGVECLLTKPLVLIFFAYVIG